ncbi:MAG: FecR family protein [Pseudomonadales bacterium]
MTTQQPNDDEAALAEVLRAAGRRPKPDEAQLERWQQQFAAELGAGQARQRRQLTSRLLAAGAAAAILAAVVVGLWPEPAMRAPADVAQVLRVVGGNVTDGADGGRRTLRAGDPVGAGDRLTTGIGSGLALAYRGAEVRLDADTSVRVELDALQLEAGRVYVDTAPGEARSLRVVTPAGNFRHAGTQFLVAVEGDRVMGAVREGTIHFRHADGEVALTADATTARQLTVDADGLREAALPRQGGPWSWVTKTAPGMSLAGSSADEALRWAARELGLTLVYADNGSARLAEAVRMAGSRAPVSPEEALQVVAQAAGLEVSAQPDGRLRVATP